MGVWFLSIAFGNKLAGSLAGYVSTMPLSSMFGSVAVALIVTAVLMFLLSQPVRRLMGERQ